MIGISCLACHESMALASDDHHQDETGWRLLEGQDKWHRWFICRACDYRIQEISPRNPAEFKTEDSYEDILSQSPTARLLMEKVDKLGAELPKLRQIADIVRTLVEKGAGDPMVTAFCRVVFKSSIDALDKP